MLQLSGVSLGSPRYVRGGGVCGSVTLTCVMSGRWMSGDGEVRFGGEGGRWKSGDGEVRLGGRPGDTGGGGEGCATLLI